MQKRIVRLDKSSIGSKFYRVDFFRGTRNNGQGRMRIHLRRAQTRIVLGASDLSGLLHGIEVGTGKGRHLLCRTAKGAPYLVRSIDQSDVNNRGKIGIDPKSQQVVSSLRALMSGHMDIPGLKAFSRSPTVGVNITQAVIVPPPSTASD